MAKIYGLFGTMTGKVADIVMSVRNGEQIVRRYQPVVFNPNTPSQIASRAKLKLMSQMSAIFAPVIAIPRVGTKSSRNLFIKKNYDAATYNNNSADINLTSVKLTESVIGFSVPRVTRPQGNVSASVILSGMEVDKVVFVVVQRMEDNSLRLTDTKVIDVVSGEATVTASLTALSSSLPVVVYSYGIRVNSETARVRFGDLTVMTAEMIASLIANRTLSSADITLTETTAAIGVPEQAKNEEEKTSTKGK